MIGAAFGLAGSPGEARTGRAPKHVSVVNELGTPERFEFLDDAHVARRPAPSDREGFDLGILVDGGVERCGPELRAIFGACRAKVYVDHHRAGSRADYDVALVDPARAS